MRSFLIVSLLLFTKSALGVQSFMPENTLNMFDNQEELSNINEKEFNQIIDIAEKFYGPLLKDHHKATLKIERKWTDSTVNAYAYQSGKLWYVAMFGGLARRPEVTKDGFALVICHELGHHLAGYPSKGVNGWASNEGQSDYFSTLSCARELWRDQHEVNSKAAKTIPSYPKKICDEQYPQDDDRNLCYRSVQAGFSLAALLSSNTARYDRPDKTVVKVTNDNHPNGQARLDTYLAGSLCNAIEFDKNVIPKTKELASAFACLQSRNEVGYRPLSWFKP